jgi:hypothetical protein
MSQIFQIPSDILIVALSIASIGYVLTIIKKVSSLLHSKLGRVTNFLNNLIFGNSAFLSENTSYTYLQK